jgi:putative nucleotidyltransferase with HDIG domain
MKLFPEIDNIRDKRLKEKVLKVWDKAMEMGKWKEEELNKIPFTLLLPHTKISIIEHTRAVTQCSLKIADFIESFYQDIKINRDYLIAGCLLHDVGKLLEYEKTEDGFRKSRIGKLLRHPVMGANLASEFGIPLEVLHIIYTHSKEGDIYERTMESIIVHHSDFINFESLKRKSNG